MSINPELAAKVSRGAFEERYANSADPWEFASSEYELNRYDCVIRALTKSRYSVAYEPGCSIGVLTQKLARVSSRVIAADIAPSAVAQARVRCRELANVEIVCDSVATFVPPAALDLVVFSEIGYYFESSELARIAARLAQHLQAGGELIAVHWLGDSVDHVLHGNEVHDTLKNVLALDWIKGEAHEHFRIDSWIKA